MLETTRMEKDFLGTMEIPKDVYYGIQTTRALENQVFFLSLNRAGDNYGNSVMSWPWMDENRRPVSFEEHAEDFRVLTLMKSELTAARENYSFLADRFGDYGALPKLAK